MLQRLSRVTSTGRFVPEIDGLRFMAIIAVVLFHIQKHVFPAWTDFASLPSVLSLGDGAVVALRGMINTGWIGVQLFFIISGFILSTPFAEHHLSGSSAPGLGKYFLRRVTRLEPPYIINLLLLYGLTVWVASYSVSGGQGRSAGELAPHFLASLLYSHNLAYGDHSLINNVAWTLEIEVQFYLLAPLLACVFKISSTPLRRSAIVAGILAGCLFGHWRSSLGPEHERLAYVLGMTLLGQFKFFLIGFLLADLYLVDWHKSPVKQWRWDALGLAAWLAIPFMIRTEVPWLDEAWGDFHAGWRYEYILPAVMLAAYVGAFRGRALNLFFRYPWITAVGGMCYTIYLYHNTVIFFTMRSAAGFDLGLGAGVNGVARAGLLIFAVVACGALMFVLFERPFMNRHWPRWVAQQARAIAARLSGKGLALEPQQAQPLRPDKD
jgi:peptidoglycan/LPS O-acetylase OafA/YrhL